MAGGDDDEPATVIGRSDGRPLRAAEGAQPIESPTRQVSSPLAGPTRAMPAGYGMAAFAPPPRPSAPRPAAGRPAVPRIVDDPTSESDMTLIERIDAELESKTAELEIPEGVDASLLEESTDGGASSEATVRLAVPDDLPADLLDAESEPGTSPRRPTAAPSLRGGRQPTPMPAPSFSSMPTPPRGTRTEGPAFAPPPDPPSAEPAAPPVSAAAPLAPQGPAEPSPIERVHAPAPAWVGPYLVVCFVVSLMGVIALTYLKLQRYW